MSWKIVRGARPLMWKHPEFFGGLFGNLRVPIPNKVKIVLWRACFDALPTKVSLQKIKVLDNSLCNECQIAPGDSFHALWSCEALNFVRLPKFSWLRSRYPKLRSVSDLSVIVKESARLDVFAMVAWSVWFRRNKLRCNEQSLPMHKVFESTTLLFEF